MPSFKTEVSQVALKKMYQSYICNDDYNNHKQRTNFDHKNNYSNINDFKYSHKLKYLL